MGDRRHDPGLRCNALGLRAGRRAASPSPHGLRVGVVNARFIKPLDRATVCKALEEAAFVLTVEEGCLMGGFGSAVLEAASDAGIPGSEVRRLGLPDRFVLHAEHNQQLAEVGLDVEGIIRSAIASAETVGSPTSRNWGLIPIRSTTAGTGWAQTGLGHGVRQDLIGCRSHRSRLSEYPASGVMEFEQESRSSGLRT